MSDVNTATNILHDLYRKALATDDAWMAEIKRAFPSERAGDVRYTEKGHGEPGTLLADAYAAFRAASDALHVATRKARAEAT